MKTHNGWALRYLWICCLVVCCSSAQGQGNNYLVTWLGIPIVDITVAVEPADSLIQGIYTAKTRSWFEPFYPVDNRYTISCAVGNYLPVHYAKLIIEKGNTSSFSTAYLTELGQADYSNGLQRLFPPDYHNLFSSLLWVEQHDWQAGERLDINVEIEGTLWHVATHCREIIAAKAGPLAEIEVKFVATIAGEPVLSHTDIVTHRLPAVGHKMIFFVQIAEQLVKTIEFGRLPFQVRATLVAP